MTYAVSFNAHNWHDLCFILFKMFEKDKTMNLASSESEPFYLSIFSYAEELDLLIKWKVIPLGSFHNIVSKRLHKTYSYRLADKLVEACVAHKIKNFRGNFHLLIPSKDSLN